MPRFSRSQPLNLIPRLDLPALQTPQRALRTAAIAFVLTLASIAGVQADDRDHELEGVFQHLDFLVGTWTGEGLGGQTAEAWLPPSEGQMLGLFRLVGGNMPRFSEILTIGRFEGQIELRLKHFDEQLHGWEEKDDVVSFPYESSEPGTVVFRGLTFKDAGEDRLRIELQLRNAERTWTEVFEFERSAP